VEIVLVQLLGRWCFGVSVGGWLDADVESRPGRFSHKQSKCQRRCLTMHCHCSPNAFKLARVVSASLLSLTNKALAGNGLA
jgi:hypothetical protein